MRRVPGLLLFLFIPLVLFLFVRQPVSPAGSLLVGAAIMFSHRLVARPYMLANLKRRCLWCGAAVETGESVPAGDRGGPLVFSACEPSCRDRALVFVAFAERRRFLFLAGIGVPLVVHIATGLLSAAGLPVLSDDARLVIFRGVIAVTVVSAAIFHRTEPIPTRSPRFPFPIHNVFLLGIRWTLAVFVVVGALWLTQTALLLLGL